MYERLIFVVPPELAIGYELAGVEVYHEKDPQKAAKLIYQLVTIPDIGLIVISDHFYQALDPSFLKRIETKVKPVLMHIPRVTRFTEPIETTTYVREAIKQVTGFYLKIDLERNE